MVRGLILRLGRSGASWRRRVEPGLHQVRSVPDVVQPRGRHKHPVPEAKTVGYTLRLRSHRLHMAPAPRQPASKMTIGQGASIDDLRHGPRAYDSSQRGQHSSHRAALPNKAVFRIKAAPAAPLARRQRRALPLGGPPVARRAQPRRNADLSGLLKAGAALKLVLPGT